MNIVGYICIAVALVWLIIKLRVSYNSAGGTAERTAALMDEGLGGTIQKLATRLRSSGKELRYVAVLPTPIIRIIRVPDRKSVV